ncbi:Starch-binding associating with outer membrane [Chitinophaga costaii]|uniref:Starch-binding associating with outer membrane n=1 Tax=Chitinophaga costaii TaxID=1335309 RepID=A0A1C4EPJ1_9BACT|nr:RagB/SusD family nutrient uptake outer membrane protein [Chitinophaga costaii]SCC45486.1 Starch-binding associating with outer membrane [Chitinophaga costaii]
MQTFYNYRIRPTGATGYSRMPVGLFGLLLASVFAFTGCKKLVTIDEPANTITTPEVFSSDQQAYAAIAGMYSVMINASIYSSFSNGGVTVLAGFSADELNNVSPTYLPFVTNQLLAKTALPDMLWRTAYTTIYNANAIIEGIAASKGAMHDSVKTALTGEAKFVRAFSYYYLTGMYGDVPLALTIDFNQTIKAAKTPQAQVYQQMIQDLQDAQATLPADYSAGSGERIRPNRLAATALLARVYLCTHDYAAAATQASTVINNTALFHLETDLNNVFLKNSAEAIWQLQQNTAAPAVGSATPEGITFMPNPLATGVPSLATLTNELMAAFETGDQRRNAWIDSSDNSQSGTPALYYYPYKYKTGKHNTVVGGTATEYYMVLRLAEQYLIRAEAAANGAPGGLPAAITDLNVIRVRAGLPPLPATLEHDAVIAAVAHERQIELFAEWGHRWLDLKRTGQAHAVLSQLPGKQPWTGDFQLLYPVPATELQRDPNLSQNEGY